MRHLRNLAFATCLLYFAVGGWSCRSHETPVSGREPVRLSAAQAGRTVVTPHTQTPIDDRNVLWCGTFQLAWNELAKLYGGKVKYAAEPPAMARVLDGETFTAADLDDASYLVGVGNAGPELDARVDRDLVHKFGPAARQWIRGCRLSPPAADIELYAYLLKHLEFPVPYERGDAPVPFSDEKVECFGMGTDYKPGRGAMAQQTIILDYQSADDFVVELKTKSTGDRLILAKVQPGATLAATIAGVQKRVATAKPQAADAADVLVVPKISFDLSQQYQELVGTSLQPLGGRNQQILTADQSTRFQLDEVGVKLESRAQMTIGCSANVRPTPTHVMVFDKPFLVLMARQDAKNPYFALWVANAQLLVTK